MATKEQELIEKIRRLPPEKIQEVEDFVNFLDHSGAMEERAFMRAVIQGMADIDAGRTVNVTEARKRLGLK